MIKRRILIVEDDRNISLGLEELLGSEGFEASVCMDGLSAVARVKEFQPDLLLLDVMLPGKSGYDICRELRALKLSIPILMLTAKGQELDKVVGLELGADDYVVKPFGVRELLARVHALLRRAAPPVEANHDAAYQIGEATIDPARMILTRAGMTVELTAKELQLLTLFHKHTGEVLSRDRLLNEVWGISYFGNTRTLDQVIVQLRKKLGDDGGAPRLLKTVHGVGYRLVSETPGQTRQA